MKFQWIQSHSEFFSIEKMASLLEVSTSGYYEFVDRKPSRRFLQNIQILERIRDSFERSLNLYGSPRITQDLKAKGFRVGMYL
jgi:hypothetical protein